MALISCQACGNQISSAAEACPQCGHPNSAAPRRQRQPTGPSCYACSNTATTRCQSCGTLSCASHLDSIYVRHGRGGAYELRCKDCYSSAQAWQAVGCVISIIVLIIMAVIFLNMTGGRF